MVACTADPYDSGADDDSGVASSGGTSVVDAYASVAETPAVAPDATHAADDAAEDDSVADDVRQKMIHMHLLHIERLRARVDRERAKDAASLRANRDHVVPKKRHRKIDRLGRRIVRVQAKVEGLQAQL